MQLARSNLVQAMLLDTLAKVSDFEELAKQRETTISEAARELHDLDAKDIADTINNAQTIIVKDKLNHEDEIAGELKLIEELDEAENELEEKTDELDDEDEFDDALEEQEGKVEDEIIRLDPTAVERVVQKIVSSLEKHLIVLEAVLAKAPEAAKPGLENAIASSSRALLKRLESDDSLLEKLFKGKKMPEEVEKKILERLDKEAQKQGEKLGKIVEKATEKASRQLEKQKEENKKQDEKRIEKEKKELEKKGDELRKQQEEQKTSAGGKKTDSEDGDDSKKSPQTDVADNGDDQSSPNSSDSTSGSSGPSGSTDSKETKTVKQEIEIKIKDFKFDKTSYTVKKDARVTVKFRNDDDTTHSLVLDDYTISSVNVAPDQETTLTFIAVKNTTFSCGLHPSIPKGTISIE